MLQFAERLCELSYRGTQSNSCISIVCELTLKRKVDIKRERNQKAIDASNYPLSWYEC